MIGRIIRIISNQYLVVDEEGRRVTCVAMGAVWQQTNRAWAIGSNIRISAIRAESSGFVRG